MRRLVVLSVFPAVDPATSGGELRLLHLYRALSRHFRIDLIGWTNNPHGRRTVQLDADFAAHHLPVPPEHAAAIAHLKSRGIEGALFNTAVAMLGRTRTEYHELADELIAGADCVIHESPYTLFYDRGIGRDSKPRVYDAHNFEADMAMSYSTSPEIREFAFNLERRLALDSAAVFATSELDAAKFACIYGVSPNALQLSPNGFDAGDIPTRAAPADTAGPLSAAFLGSAHPPNIAAARYIAERLAPAFEDIAFLIAGGVAEHIDEHVPSNVTLLKSFDQNRKRRILAETDIFLNPLEAGSGTSIKTIEAMAAGLAVLSTPVGCRGLNVEHGREVLIAETADFPASLGRLAADRTTRLALGAAASAWAAQGLEWTMIADRMVEPIERLCDGHRPEPVRKRPRLVLNGGTPDRSPPEGDSAAEIIIQLDDQPTLAIDRLGPERWRIRVPISHDHRYLRSRLPFANQPAVGRLLQAMHCLANPELCRLFLKIAPRAAAIECFDIGLLPLAQLCGPMPDIRFRPGIERQLLTMELAAHPASALFIKLADQLWHYGGTLYGDGIEVAPEWATRRIVLVGDDFDEDAPSPAVTEFLTHAVSLSGVSIDHATMSRAAAGTDAPAPLAPAFQQFYRVQDHPHYGTLLSEYALVLAERDGAEDRRIAEAARTLRKPFRFLPSPEAPLAAAGTQRVSGFDPAHYLFNTEHDYLFSRAHSSERPFLLVLGRKQAEAGIPFICRAFDMGGSPHGDLLFIGPGDETLVQRSDAIFSYNALDRPAVLGALRRCRALVTLRTSNGTRAPVEAWLSERAVIANRINREHGNLIEHGTNGFLVGPHEELAAAMTLLLCNPPVAAVMGQRGRRAADRFTWSHVVRTSLAREHDRL